MNHPYPALTPVVSKMEPLLGLIVDADRTSNGYRYHVMISPEADQPTAPKLSTYTTTN